MRDGTASWAFLLSILMVAKSMHVVDDPSAYEEDDPENRPWQIPNQSDETLVAIEDDVLMPVNETLTRKGMDFDSFIQGMFKWRDGIVYYSFGKGITPRHERVINDSMRHWEEHTCLKFEPAGRFQYTFYINFRGDREGCYSRLGRFLFGQDLNLGRGCVARYVAVHEIGHAIGFFHEQSRTDRDEFIKILWHNVKDSWKKQFEKGQDVARGVPYDYSSVMQYEADAAASAPEKNTMVTLDPFMQLSLGNSELSFRDRKLANDMYNCDAKCPNRKTLKCENEGFMFQRHDQTGNCTCICPPNTSGSRCETRLDRSYYDYPRCSGNITTEGPIQTPNAPHTTQADGGCIFWIQAPSGKVVQVHFSAFNYRDRRSFSDSALSDRKCTRDRVEIRTEDLYEGKMYCSNDLENKTVTSSAQDMIIIAAPKHSGHPGGFKATVSFVDVGELAAAGDFAHKIHLTTVNSVAKTNDIE